MREGPKHDPVKAQLRSSSGRSSKVVKDREAIEVVVEVPGARWCSRWTAEAATCCGLVGRATKPPAETCSRLA
jgi:hypothetical protein